MRTSNLIKITVLPWVCVLGFEADLCLPAFKIFLHIFFYQKMPVHKVQRVWSHLKSSSSFHLDLSICGFWLWSHRSSEVLLVTDTSQAVISNPQNHVPVNKV